MKKPGKMAAEVLRSLLKDPATTQYPFVKIEMPPKFRGKLTFHPEKCICCKLCMKDCPTAAINITKVGEKRFQCDIDLGRCIYCAQCVDSCPKAALETTTEFELASLNRDTLKVTFDAAPEKPTTQTPQAEPPKPADGPEKKAP